MNTVLVTIVGPDGRTDAAAPADTPLAELLATFAQLTGARGAHDWELSSPGHPPLASGRTLGEQGVADGSVLHLRPAGAPPEPAAPDPLAALPAAPDGSSPVQRTREALPEWFGRAGRLRAALGGGGADGGESWPRRVRAGWTAAGYRPGLERSIAAPRLRRPIAIGVVSSCAGAGRSTVALALASLLSQARGEPVCLIDAARAGASHLAVDDPFGSGLPGAFVTGPYGLLTLAPSSGHEPDGLDAAEHERLIASARAAAGVSVIDCGPGLDDPAAQAALRAADQLVVVVEAGPLAAALVAEAGARLAGCAAGAVLAVNRIPPRGLEVGGLEHELPAARGLVAIGSDERQVARLAAGTFAWDAAARRGWDLPLRELAAVLAADWPRQGLAA